MKSTMKMLFAEYFARIMIRCFLCLLGAFVAYTQPPKDAAAYAPPNIPFRQQTDRAMVTTVGIVLARPSNYDGYGEWSIQLENDDLLALQATAARSAFLTLPPTVGELIYITYEADAANSGHLITMMKLDRKTFAVPTGANDLTHVILHGSITTNAPSSDGVGNWKLYSDRGIIYEFEVYSAAAFTGGIPGQGQDVYVSGWKQAGNYISADSVILDDGTQQIETVEQSVTALSGEVIATPLTTGQYWYIRDTTTVYVVETNADTQFYPSIPVVGSYVDLVVVSRGDDTPPLVVTMSSNTYVLGEIIVRLQPSADIVDLVDAYKVHNAEVIVDSMNIYRLVVRNPTPAYLIYFVKILSGDPAVIWADLNFVGKLPIAGHPHRTWGWGGKDDATYINQAAFEQINIGDIHGTYLGQGQIIAVLDTGIDYNHPQLKSFLLDGIDYVDDDVVAEDDGPGNAQGHGTHVGGIALRVAPASHILPIRVLDADGRGDLLDVARGIEWAVEHKATVINLSLGTDEDSPLLHDTIRWATNQGVSIVVAAGNDDSEELHYPAAYTETIAVTALDAELKKADFANYGPWVDLSAPGVGITSTIVTAQGSGYAAWSGTSMAAPFVSGTATLLHEKYPTMSAAAVKARLIQRGDIVNAMDHQQSMGALLNVKNTIDDPSAPQNAHIYIPYVILTTKPNVTNGER